MQIILGSTSSYRKQLLQRLGIEFDTAAPDIDETILSGESPHELVARLSINKAKAVADHFANSLIIASDQIAVFNGEILGKPGNHERATQQLLKLSGNTVIFYTGLCLFNTDTLAMQIDVIPFKVIFRKLSAEQVENYLAKDQPYDCAGSFKSEGLGVALFERLEGDDPSALIGLPLIRLCKMLAQEGINII